ncbi:MAG: PPOX class F420-dependent oxidoreductase [Actinomycetota bacterium]
MARIATEDTVGLPDLLDFIRPRNQWMLTTMRTDGRPQISPVTGGVGASGELLVATYPMRDKVHNLRRDPRASICVLSDHFGGAWVQVDGEATVTDVPEAVDGLVEYFRAVAGEHSDWDEYRAAMVRHGKSLVSIAIERWGPIATGGFPAPVIPLLGGDDAGSGDDGEAGADGADGPADVG